MSDLKTLLKDNGTISPRLARALRKELENSKLTPDQLLARMQDFFKQETPPTIVPAIWLIKQRKKALETPFLIHVERSTRPDPDRYPDLMEKLLNPELETTGIAEYDITKIQLYLHFQQERKKYVLASEVYELLQSTGAINNCLNLQDALAIKEQGFDIFNPLFKDQSVLFWKSVVEVRHAGGSHNEVPCLYESKGFLFLRWKRLDEHLFHFNPALHFPQ